MIVIISASHVKNTMAYHMKNTMFLRIGGKMVNTTVPWYYHGAATFTMVTMVTFYHDAIMHSSTVGYIILQCVRQKGATIVLALTLPNANRVSFFDRH